MSFLLIMNPGSRSGRGKQLWKIWECGLRDAGAAFNTIQTSGVGDAIRIAKSAKDDETVVAVGGDGTINEVLDGVIQSGKHNVRMGVLYSGTSPDFCRFHKIPIEPKAALQTLLAGNNFARDVARIVYHDRQGAQYTAHFGCSSNIGMGASIACHANRTRRYLGDTLGTALAVLGTVIKNNLVDLDLEIDNEIIPLVKTNNLTIAKNPYIASGLKLQVDIKPDDGKLWIIGIHGKNRIGMLKLIPSFYTGAITAKPEIFMRCCNKIIISSQKSWKIEFDGDPKGYLPIHVEILPKALRLVGNAHE
ncbi:MAG: diacylglycerol kinase family protein [candidate division Zixibacteria bacterium]|nr:diacylglycerol kinase family protein [candidate division Zixibacteria bacterium]